MYETKIILDSVSPAGGRLTTFCFTFPRVVLAEFNTHRLFCLAGDAELEFDLPAGTKGKYKRVYRMRIDEFADKWLYGARRTGANPKLDYDTSWIDPTEEYSSPEAAARFGMANATNINHYCKLGKIKAVKHQGQWLIRGAELLYWRNSSPEHTRFDMHAKLSGMKIRQLNEDTGDIQTSNVVRVFESGEKEVFEVTAGDFRVAGSEDHRVFTTSGWKTIGQLTTSDYVVVRKFGKKNDDRLDPLRLQRIDGVWRAPWQRIMREELRSKDTLCRRCRSHEGTEIHHLVPVHVDPSRTFDSNNITLLCDACHDASHAKQGWQGGTYLYGAAAKVIAVKRRGVEKTYDLEVAGKYPNFLANGIVVHNSRNSASSRAIPVERMIKRVEEDPFIPHYWGKNQKGMQAEKELSEEEQAAARDAWLLLKKMTVGYVKGLLDLGLHKQLANRPLEAFNWHTVVCSATEYENYFALRDNKDAAPEIRDSAHAAQELYRNSSPIVRGDGEYHLPFVEGYDMEDLRAEDFTLGDLINISVGRCAAVSYLNHENTRDPRGDISRAVDRLFPSGHMSPFEHVAEALSTERWEEIAHKMAYQWIYNRVPVGNMWGWLQHRKTLTNEHNFRLIEQVA